MTSQLSSPIQFGCPLLVVCESNLVNILTFKHLIILQQHILYFTTKFLPILYFSWSTWLVYFSNFGNISLFFQDIGSCSIKTPYSSAPLQVGKRDTLGNPWCDQTRLQWVCAESANRISNMFNARLEKPLKGEKQCY